MNACPISAQEFAQFQRLIFDTAGIKQDLFGPQ